MKHALWISVTLTAIAAAAACSSESSTTDGAAGSAGSGGLAGSASGGSASGGSASGGSAGSNTAGSSSAGSNSGGSQAGGSGGVAGASGSGGSAGSVGGSGGSAAGSGGSGASAGSSSGGSGAGGSGGAAGTGSGGSSASGGSSGSTSGGSGGSAPEDCTGEKMIEGTVGGISASEDWSYLSVASLPVNPWQRSHLFDDLGSEMLRGTIATKYHDLPAGDYSMTHALAVSPSTSAFGGRALCLGSPKMTVFANGRRRITATDAALLAECSAGTPVAGEVKLCGSSGCSTGSIEGTNITANNPHLSGSGVGATNINARNDQMYVRAFVDKPLTSAATGGIIKAVLVTYPESPFGGGVYCAGAGSSFGWITSEGTYVTMKSLRKIGTCKAGAGSDEVTMCR